MSLERTAKSYVNLGMHVVPYGQNGHPIVKDYMNPGVACTTVEDVEYRDYNWRYGVGIVLSLSDLVMVDIDMHDSRAENGLLSIETVCKRYAEGGLLPETWTYSTPRGGRHLLFRRPDDFPKEFSTGFFAPGVELKVNCPTPMPPTVKWKLIGEKSGRKFYEKTSLQYQWMDNGAEDPEDWHMLQPGPIELAVLPDWLTTWARYKKVPLLSDQEYEKLTGYKPPIIRGKGASVYERFVEKHQREPESPAELLQFQKVEIGALALLDGIDKRREREERYRLTGSTRTTREYSLEQVQELIDTSPLDVIGKPDQKGHLMTWRLRTCPLDRARNEDHNDGHAKGSEGNATISYDPQTRTPMFYCFEGKCVDLVDCEFDGNWWKALLDSLEVIERLTGEQVLRHLETKEPLPTPTVSASTKKTTKKSKQPLVRRDERGAMISDCQNGLTPPWESHTPEEHQARLADLDAFIEKQYTDAKRSLCGCAPTVEERRERAKLADDPESDFLALLKSEEDWKRWNFSCRSTRHMVLCFYCDVPLDELQERLDKRFAVNHEERDAERVRFEGIYNYYVLQTTEDNNL